MRMMLPGANAAASVNRRPMATESRSEIAITRSIVRRSPLPQYCAASTDAPDAMPNSSMFKTNATCPASEDADSSFCPTSASITTSAELTHASIRF